MKTITRFLAGCALMIVAFCLLAFAFGGTAFAQTDMGATITTISGYWTTVEALAIGILCFVLGRRVLRKL